MQHCPAVLTESVSRGDAPGVVAVVVDKKGEIFKGAAGNLNPSKAALPDDAIFNIASMTKPVTSVAVMMLVEQGRMSIDDPVSKYLAGFDHLEVVGKYNEADGAYEARPATQVMTIRHLLTHTSGIGYSFSSAVRSPSCRRATIRPNGRFPCCMNPASAGPTEQARECWD
jgi:methyl acetate hydrolase